MKGFLNIGALVSASALAALIAAPGASRAEDSSHRASMANPATSGPRKTLADAETAYRALVKEAKVPQSVYQNSMCVAILPGVVTAAVGVGGSHGNGVAFCRSGTGWSRPVFVRLTGGTLGAQIGVKQSDVFLFMTADQAKKTIENGKMSLSGELSAVAGSYDETFVPPRSGVVAYTKTSGAFLGASISGMDLARDEDDHKKFYANADPNLTFDGEIPPESKRMIDEMKELLPG